MSGRNVLRSNSAWTALRAAACRQGRDRITIEFETKGAKELVDAVLEWQSIAEATERSGEYGTGWTDGAGKVAERLDQLSERHEFQGHIDSIEEALRFAISEANAVAHDPPSTEAGSIVEALRFLLDFYDRSTEEMIQIPNLQRDIVLTNVRRMLGAAPPASQKEMTR